jgi:trimethylamine:corrinoid methyltransferase-like protein
LELLGLERQNPAAFAILEGRGAEVDRASQMVRFDRALIRALVAKAQPLLGV